MPPTSTPPLSLDPSACPPVPRLARSTSTHAVPPCHHNPAVAPLPHTRRSCVVFRGAPGPSCPALSDGPCACARAADRNCSACDGMSRARRRQQLCSPSNAHQRPKQPVRAGQGKAGTATRSHKREAPVLRRQSARQALKHHEGAILPGGRHGFEMMFQR